jgi:hypothetical protein
VYGPTFLAHGPEVLLNISRTMTARALTRGTIRCTVLFELANVGMRLHSSDTYFAEIGRGARPQKSQPQIDIMQHHPSNPNSTLVLVTINTDPSPEQIDRDTATTKPTFVTLRLVIRIHHGKATTRSRPFRLVITETMANKGPSSWPMVCIRQATAEYAAVK